MFIHSHNAVQSQCVRGKLSLLTSKIQSGNFLIFTVSFSIKASFQRAVREQTGVLREWRGCHENDVVLHADRG